MTASIKNYHDKTAMNEFLLRIFNDNNIEFHSVTINLYKFADV